MLTNKGQTGAWEGLIILILMAGLGLTIWLWAKKPSESAVYQANSRPVIYDVKPSFGGCASFGVERMRDALRNKT